jgi:hypothetical protein
LVIRHGAGSAPSLLGKIGPGGWVRGTEVANMGDVLENVAAAAKLNAQLQTENAELRRKLTTLESEMGARRDYGGRSFQELAQLLLKRRVKFTDENSIKSELGLAELMYGTRDQLAAGVTSAANASEIEREIFYQVAVPLSVYNLVERAPVPANVHWQRLVLSASGKSFLSELEHRMLSKRGKSDARPEGKDAGSNSLSAKPKPKSAAKKKSRVSAAAKNSDTKGTPAPVQPRRAAKKQRASARTE